MMEPENGFLIEKAVESMVDIVFKYSGSVDKFIGDCIMAVWGAPVAIPEEAVAAVTAAVIIAAGCRPGCGGRAAAVRRGRAGRRARRGRRGAR